MNKTENTTSYHFPAKYFNLMIFPSKMAGLPAGDGQLNIGPEKTVTTRVGILCNPKTVNYLFRRYISIMF